jgi:hypothetical protein
MPTPNEQRWLAAWRYAGPELQRIRNEELRNLDNTLVPSTPEPPAESPYENGLVILQAWMMRFHCLQLQKKLRELTKNDP